MSRYSVSPTPYSTAKELAARCKQLRKSFGYTQQELAERSGVSYGTLKRFEQSGEVALLNLLRIAHTMHRLDEFSSLFLPDERAEAEAKLRNRPSSR